MVSAGSVLEKKRGREMDTRSDCRHGGPRRLGHDILGGSGRRLRDLSQATERQDRHGDIDRWGHTYRNVFHAVAEKSADESAEFELQHKRGPFFRLSYVKEGVDPSSPRKLLIGCLHYLSVSVLATFLLWLAGPRSRCQGWAVVFVGGLLGSNLITIGDPVWFHLPWDYSRAVLLYEVIAWLLLGLAVTGVSPFTSSLIQKIDDPQSIAAQ